MSNAQSFDLGYIVSDQNSPEPVDTADSSAAESKFDPKIAEHRKALQEQIDNLTAKYRADHPEVQGLAMHAAVSVRLRRPKGFYRVPAAILQHMLIRDGFQRTQEEILEAIRPQFSEFNISKNIWVEEHRNWQLKKLRAMVQNHGSIAQVSNCRTLAAFRRALQAAAAKRDGHEYKANIVISDTQVSIAGLVLKISTSKANGSTYRTIRPNVDRLQAALVNSVRSRKQR